tara:strand:+ start:144800 stop:145054 length:255 start_codon:yes stop_codon:yes gene_type:complete
MAKASKEIKCGAEVVVIAGAHKGKRGKVLQRSKDGSRIVVEGVAMGKKHQRATQDNPEGSIVERERAIDFSNVMLAQRFDARSK